jgi:hypothetical protein
MGGTLFRKVLEDDRTKIVPLFGEAIGSKQNWHSEEKRDGHFPLFAENCPTTRVAIVSRISAHFAIRDVLALVSMAQIDFAIRSVASAAFSLLSR